MKVFYTLIILVFTSPLLGTLDEEFFGKADFDKPEKSKPFQFQLKFDSLCKAEFNNKEFKGQKFQYAEGNISIGGVWYYNPCITEGAIASIGYTQTRLDWKKNPFFCDKDFSYYNFGLSFFSKRICDWLWRGQVIINVDTKHSELSHYMNYDLLFWGRYQHCSGIGLHAGFCMEVGMKVDRIYPIIGVDWKYKDKWKFNAVFPVDMSIEYLIDDCWTAAGEIRFFETRYRVGKNEPLSMGIWEHRTWGAELAIKYDDDCWLSTNAHIGMTTGGKLKISNRHHSDSRRFDFCPSFYIGGDLFIRF